MGVPRPTLPQWDDSQAKAMCLGADGVALANSAMQAISCGAAPMSNINLCPDGVATQKPDLCARLDVEASAKRLARFLTAGTELMKILARACSHDHIRKFEKDDITSCKRGSRPPNRPRQQPLSSRCSSPWLAPRGPRARKPPPDARARPRGR